MVKSAQYNRKMVPIIATFRGANLYARIKKVDDMIEHKKRMLNTSLEQESLKKSMEVYREKILP